MKKWAVNYAVTVHYDTVVMTHTRYEAIAKVLEVVGDDVKIEQVRELPTEEK